MRHERIATCSDVTLYIPDVLPSILCSNEPLWYDPPGRFPILVLRKLHVVY
jgi:hypothetical protein